ncbi:phosphomannomutase/phosphoglucomutase [Enterococcus hirae]|uniref:phosphomannomutase/phosphoglucomutase n=1 Tax=Enterococcus hirae TaxID=1354 RepID=UPI0019EF813C|nr:phosphomannomutase/phosphoglucomutase [Enterococcus hirae]EMF0122637.1 phosphomannomutase/phosphoglucomutase [Enterococcus hirae]EMF0141975.1 phosphomannomutase/phosphoglucomutase [Enterococcus hirae]EMF0164967.1 phosphomannomutase/phosphoglucomutase [Enterococcus hirae]MCA6766805.1 phosphomannomutase/phosphoglucomutase [Enterococcus hirae]
MSLLKALQNGSDIRGIAMTTETHSANLTPAEIQKISCGLVNWLKRDHPRKYQEGKLTVGVGRDSRISGPTLEKALIDGLIEQGINVLDFELATTPAMFMATQFSQFHCDASVMLTASHLPFYFNGMKFFTANGGAEKEDIAFILSETTPNKTNHKGTVQKADLLTPYADDLVQKIKNGIRKKGMYDTKPLAGWRIIVDAGNGSGGFFAEKVLQRLGADTTGSQFLDPDGHFPNHIPNPDNAEAMASIKQAVLENQADLGVIFDTDVDRSAVVSASGQVINRNNLIALLSTIVLKEYPGATIVTNSPTSNHLETFIEEKGGRQDRYISGYRNVINRAIACNKEGIYVPLAIETSGHAAFKENYFLDDGAYVIAKILMLLPELKQTEQTLEEIIHDLKQPQEVQEIRLRLSGEDPKKQGATIIQGLANELNEEGLVFHPENEEGIRYDLKEPYGNGWFLLRASLHEPLLVLQIENDEVGKNQHVLQLLAEHLKKYSNVEPLIVDTKEAKGNEK